MIFDFETLGQKPRKNAVLSLAMLEYDENKFLKGYKYDELLEKCNYIKFDVEDQVLNCGRKIDPKTLEWWKSQGPSARKVLLPSKEDRKISELRGWIEEHYEPQLYEKVFTRGNTFDVIFLDEIAGEDIFPWYAIRDTRSYLDGLLHGVTDADNRFVPPQYKDKFVAHDARHDIVMDVLRMQTCIQELTL